MSDKQSTPKKSSKTTPPFIGQGEVLQSHDGNQPNHLAQPKSIKVDPFNPKKVEKSPSKNLLKENIYEVLLHKDTKTI
jgi:hypothetical protein